MKVSPRFGDIDGLGHVNNTIMPAWFELARNPVFEIFNPERNLKKWNLILARFEVDFVSQMYYRGEIEIKTWIHRIGNSSFEVYQEAYQGNTLGAKGKTVLIYFDFKLQKSVPIPDYYREQLREHRYEDVSKELLSV